MFILNITLFSSPNTTCTINKYAQVRLTWSTTAPVIGCQHIEAAMSDVNDLCNDPTKTYNVIKVLEYSLHTDLSFQRGIIWKKHCKTSDVDFEEVAQDEEMEIVSLVDNLKELTNQDFFLGDTTLSQSAGNMENKHFVY